MALHFSGSVLRGEIHSRKNRVSGWIELDPACGLSAPHVVQLELTGNPEGELEGQKIWFECAPNRPKGGEPIPAVPGGKWQKRQIGVVDRFSLQTLPGAAGNPRQLLVMEWSGQNGPVALSLIDLETGSIDDSEETALSDLPDFDSSDSLEKRLFHRNGDDPADWDDQRFASDVPFENEDTGDPRQLFRDLSETGFRPGSGPVENPVSEWSGREDVGLPGAGEGPAVESHGPRSWDEVIPGLDPATRELYEQWDEIFHETRDEPLTTLLPDGMQLPRPELVQNEQAAWSQLRTLLSALAVRGVAFDICPHMTAVEAYRLLIEEILPEAHIHPDLGSTGIVQHYLSSEACPECMREMDGL